MAAGGANCFQVQDLVGGRFAKHWRKSGIFGCRVLLHRPERMEILALKIVLTPLVIGAASLTGRRWGESVGGWLLALPFTSGPVIFFLALEHGTSFAADAAVGSLGGAVAQALFCLGYGVVALRRPWPVALLAASLGFAIGAAIMDRLSIGLVPLFAGVIVLLLAVLRLMPGGGKPRPPMPAPAWDIPLRIAVATGFVLLLTGAAPAVGPRLSGLLATYPLFISIMVVFAHRWQGTDAAIQAVRGLLFGLFAFAGFFLALGGLIERLGIAAGFAAAIGVALGIQAISLRVLRRS